jgi:hypothetical protein
MPETTAPTKMGHAERRARFRDYMRRFNPTAPAMEAIGSGLVYEDLHGSLHTNASQHPLLVIAQLSSIGERILVS